MVDIFDEVEEELRHERYMALLRKWGPWVAAAAIAVVLGVAGYQGYAAWRSNVHAEAADRFLAARTAFEDGQLQTAATGFDTLIEEGPRGYAVLALMERGAIALRQGRPDEAAEYFAAAAERAPDRITRDLARYKSVLAAFDTLSYDDIRLRLEPLTESGSPVRLLARELLGAAALKEERWGEARQHYQVISIALDAPPGLGRRANEALALIEQRAPAEAAETEAQQENGA